MSTTVLDSFDRLRALEKKRFETERKGRIPVMDAETLRELCIENEGYETPELNDNLYAHFRGFQKIQGLEPYFNLKALWLESNGLSKMENLDSLINLRCLYLSKNLISSIENLEHLRELNTLDLSDNHITSLSGLSHLPHLASLNLARNQLTTADDIHELAECAQLNNLDVSHNHIDDAEALPVLKAIPQLKALRITGNPIVTTTRQFRKAFIAAMPNLAFLDRPIFPIERAAVTAWEQGGSEAELRAKREFVQRENDERRQTLHEFREWQTQLRERRLKELAEERAQKLATPEADDTEDGVPPSSLDSAQVDLRGFRGITKEEYVKLDATERAKWDERINQAHADSVKARYVVMGEGVKELGSSFWATAPSSKTVDVLEKQPREASVHHPVVPSVQGEGQSSDDSGDGSGCLPAVGTSHGGDDNESGVDDDGTVVMELEDISLNDVGEPVNVCTAKPTTGEAATTTLLPPPAPASIRPAVPTGAICPPTNQPSGKDNFSGPAPPPVSDDASTPFALRGAFFPGPTGTEPRETWAQLQRRAASAPCQVRPACLPSIFAVCLVSVARYSPR